MKKVIVQIFVKKHQKIATHCYKKGATKIFSWKEKAKDNDLVEVKKMPTFTTTINNVIDFGLFST